MIEKIIQQVNTQQVLNKVQTETKVLTLINKNSNVSTMTQRKSNVKLIIHYIQDLFNKNKAHIYDSGVLRGIREINYKDKDGLTYLSLSYCQNGKIKFRTLYDNQTKQIVKKYTYSAKKKDQVLEEEFFEKGKFAYSLSHEYDNARAIHTVTQKDSKKNVESIKVFNLFFPDQLMKEIKP